jgi:DNA replication protein DnaC
MITKSDAYKKAFEIKKETLIHKTKHREMMLATAYSADSRLEEIDNKLASLGSRLAITALSGDNVTLENIKKESKKLSSQKSLILHQRGITDLKYDCPLCLDTGYVNGKICDCIKKIANSIVRKNLSEKMPLDESTFEKIDLNYYAVQDDKTERRMKAIFSFCKDYALNFNPNTSENLLFLGASGLGKTHLSLAIVSAVLDKGYLPIYGPAERLFSIIQAEKFAADTTESYQQMIECDLLVIDDLGTELPNAFTISILYNLINSRLLTRKPTIISTNLSINEIKETYSPRIASRLIGSYVGKQFLGTDIRQQKLLGK